MIKFAKFRFMQWIYNRKNQYHVWRDGETTSALIFSVFRTVEFQAFAVPWLLSLAFLIASYQNDIVHAVGYTAFWLILNIPVVYNIHMIVIQHQLRKEISRVHQSQMQEWRNFLQTHRMEALDHYDAVTNHLDFLKTNLFNYRKVWINCTVLFLLFPIFCSIF